MGEIPRVARVEPTPQLAGQHLKVAQSSDRPGGQPHHQAPEQAEDQVELHEEPEGGETVDAKPAKLIPLSDEPRLDIAV